MSTSADDLLFHPARPFLPVAVTGETLYSWCAHYHLLASNVTSGDSSRCLSGHSTALLQPAFPHGLDTLLDRSGLQGKADEIVFQRTPFGIFARFLEPERIAAVVAAMRSGRPARIPRLLGLQATGLGIPVPLKVCPICIQHDLGKGRIARWYVDHQLPGVLLCRDHDCQLKVATDEAMGRAHSKFVLPHELAPSDWHATQPLGEVDRNKLRSLAHWSRTLRVDSPNGHAPFDADVHRYTCQLQAKAKGWLAIDGTLRFKQIRAEILRSYGRLATVPTLEFIADANREHGGFVGLLLRQFQGFHHPLMHIVLLSLLFDSPDDWMRTYRECLVKGAAACREELVRERGALGGALRQIVASGSSVNRAAREVGISVSLALSILDELGIGRQTRPHIVGTDLEHALARRLEGGDEPDDIARELDIRRGYIKDFLSARPELRAKSEALRFVRRRKHYRERFLKVLEDYPSLPVKRIRREVDSGFEWLYRNDRSWLEEALPGIWHRPTPP